MEIKRSISDGRHKGLGYHTLEEVCLPNGVRTRALIWHKDAPLNL